MRDFIVKWAISVSILALVACGGDSSSGKKKKNTEKEDPTPEATIVSVELSPSSLSLEVGESQKLEATVKGEGDFDSEVVWETSDAAIATVADGQVTAVAEGEATITARSKADEKKFATATVKVSSKKEEEEEEPTTGELQVKLQGLPAEAKAGVVVSGPDGFEEVLDASTLLEELEPGDYTIEANVLEVGLFRFTPEPMEIEAEVVAGKRMDATIVYTPEEIPLVAVEVTRTVPIPLFGEGGVFVEVERLEDFEGPVLIRLEGLPAGLESKPVEIEPSKKFGIIQILSDGTIRELGPREVELVAEAGGRTVRSDVTLHVRAVVTKDADDGPGTLRSYLDLVPELDTIEGGPIVIYFHPSLTGTIALETRLTVQGEVIIRGQTDRDGEPIVQLFGQEKTQIMFVDEGANVEIHNLYFVSGRAHQGGAIDNLGTLTITNSVFMFNESTNMGGAIRNRGSLEMEQCNFFMNSAPDDVFGNGAAIANSNEARLTDVIFSMNTAGSSGGAILNTYNALVDVTPILEVTRGVFHSNEARESAGGAIASSNGNVFVKASTFKANDAGYGGAIQSANGSLHVFESSFEENFAAVRGGALNASTGTDFTYDPGTIPLLVVRSSFFKNKAISNPGGGIFFWRTSGQIFSSTFEENSAESGGAIGSDGSEAHISVWSSTLVNNTAASEGGGIYIWGGVLELLQSTLAGNEAEEGGGIHLRAIGTVGRSIVSGNVADDGPEIYHGLGATLESLNFNLIGDTSDSGFVPLGGDLVNEIPGIEAMADNGGPTRTAALRLNSKAIDAIPLPACLDHEGEPLAVDQRGEPRPVGPGCDIGAYEYP